MVATSETWRTEVPIAIEWCHDVNMTQPTTNAPQPPICRAIDRALRQRGITKADVARAWNVNKSNITMWTTDREPSWQVVGRFEKFLHMARGQLYIEAGLVDAPTNEIEHLIRLDNRLTPMCQKLALENYRSLLAMSAEAADIAANEVPAMRKRAVASASS